MAQWEIFIDRILDRILDWIHLNIFRVSGEIEIQQTLMISGQGEEVIKVKFLVSSFYSFLFSTSHVYEAQSSIVSRESIEEEQIHIIGANLLE
jgi:hypothetical protein